MWHFWHFVSSAPTGHLYFPPGWVALTVRLKGPGHGQTAHPSHIMVGSVNIFSLGLNINLLLQLGFLAGLVQKRLNPQMMAYHPRTVWKVDCPSHPTAWHLDWLPSCTGMTGIAAMRTGLCVRLEVLRQVLNIFFIKLVDEDKTFRCFLHAHLAKICKPKYNSANIPTGVPTVSAWLSKHAGFGDHLLLATRNNHCHRVHIFQSGKWNNLQLWSSYHCGKG